MVSVTPSPPSIEALQERIDSLCEDLARAGGPLEGLVGRSPAMRKTFSSVLALARRDDPVWIHGESGSGRTTVAAAIHALSRRRTGPFIARRPMPGEDLAASAAAAAGGTLVVEDGEWSSSWLSTARAAGARIVRCAGPESAPEEGFDSIGLSPLRERVEDVSALADYFLGAIRDRESAAPREFDPKAIEAMRVHLWPGNVRELRTVVSRAVELTDGSIVGLTAVQSVLGGASARPTDEVAGEIVLVQVGESMADVERRLLARTLQVVKGNKRKAAEILKLSLKTIYNKIREYGLESEFGRRVRQRTR
jgi:two-component system response regulator AtoC